MGIGKLFLYMISIWVVINFQSETSMASVRSIGQIGPGYNGSQMNWIDNDGLFLLSNSSQFAFGFTTTSDVTLFLLVVFHMKSQTVVWTANRDSPVSNSDKFVFDDKGSVYLRKGGSVVWSIDTRGKAASAMELRDSGNLVLLGDDNSVIWESFSHPTDTLLWGQDFVEGMKLVSNPSSKNLTYFLEIKSGDMILSAGYDTPQPYWSMGKESRKTIDKDGGLVTVASIDSNSWKIYDKSKVLLWQFIFSDNNGDSNATWIAVLGNDGFISFTDLQSSGVASTKIPEDPCSTPEHCDAYYECFDNKCQCPSGLGSRPNCSPGIVSPCDSSKSTSTELVNAGDGLYYFALGFVSPSSKDDLSGCKTSCQNNCSCLALFFQNSTGGCFHFDRVGNFQSSNKGSGFVSFVKVLSDGGGSGDGSSQKHFPYVVIIAIATVLVICLLLYLGYRYHKRKKKLPESPHETSEEDNFLVSLSGMPVRFSYSDLQTATNNFSQKLGQGGFGSVYQGVLPDGTRLAVKKLEGIGQGKKEFRAEVSIIGSIHHVHLVRLKGFCAEGNHRLLAYEFMAKGGTRGYLAPEWITNYAISEKSDVYSYGMLLLEIIGGRKNFDPTKSSEKSHFPSYAFRMLEEGKLRDILDWKVETEENDNRVSIAIKVALWCIQEDMSLRPSMTKVVQMLEGLCTVPSPPTSSPLGSRFLSGFLKSNSDEGTSSGPSEYNSDAYLSAVRLSGPR
ncbi:hypothetical protein TIFTF001_014624 [Ficus carica]|uniref:Receptor-like serine/threonine-protein kinase n=1 Tax=Ficus carica TaxID=3494 RepID=A0AA88A5P2_FICCA|nr:hypothetical protein TIFTF001_014624 [Ficus carica]